MEAVAVAAEQQQAAGEPREWDALARSRPVHELHFVSSVFRSNRQIDPPERMRDPARWRVVVPQLPHPEPLCVRLAKQTDLSVEAAKDTSAL